MMLLGDYLCQRLYEAGVHHLFGVPGDFSLGLLNSVVRSKIEYIGTCNELNAAYAADGYARLKGIGCVTTTYAVGELSALNGIAGSWAESVPVIMLVGAPARRFFLEMPLLHHTLGDYMIPKRMFGMITSAQALLTNPRTAASEIDRVIQTCLQEKAPVYLAIPSDMVSQEIPILQHAPIFKPLPEPVSNLDSLVEAVEEVSQRLNSSNMPLLLPGVSLLRLGLEKKFENLVEKSKIPYATMLLTKGILDEENDYFIGLYSGDRSRPEVKMAIDNSDCVVILGEKLTDFNTGGFTAVFNTKTRIYVGRDHVTVSAHTYNQVYLPDFLDHLINKVKPHSIKLQRGRSSCTHRRTLPLKSPEENKDLTMEYLFRRMAHYIPENSVIMAETGASLFSCAETMLPKGCSFIGQTFYGSIGYTVGGCLGAAIACKEADRNLLLFVGDGSFQVTAQDLSTMIKYKVEPIIFLINNSGYTIERVICDNIYNDIQPWKYSKLPEIFNGDEGILVKNEIELENALNYTLQEKQKLHFIEIILDKWDCNELLKSAGRTMARNNDLN